MYSVTPKAAIAADFAMVGVSLLLVLLRLYVRIGIIHRFEITDVLICLAWCTFVWNCISDILANDWGIWNPKLEYSRSGELPDFEKYIPDKVMLRQALILGYLGPPFGGLVLYAIKANFLLWYRQVFPRDMRKLWIALNGCSVFIILVFTSVMLMNLFMCWPIPRNWTLVKEERCMTIANVPRFFYATITSILTDLLIYGLPFFLLPALYRSRSTSRRKLAAIAALMCLGALPIMCAVGRVLANASGTTASTYAVWGSAEQAGAIVVGCCPPLRYLFSRRGASQTQSNDKETPGEAGDGETERPQTRTAWRFWRIGGLTNNRRDLESTVDTYAVSRTVHLSERNKPTGAVVRIASMSRDEDRSPVVGGLAPVPRKKSSAVGPLEGGVVVHEVSPAAFSSQGQHLPPAHEKQDRQVGGLFAMIKKNSKSSERSEPSPAQSRRGSRKNRRGSNTFGGTQLSTQNPGDGISRPSFATSRAAPQTPSEPNSKTLEVNDRGFLNTLGGTANDSRPTSSIMIIEPG